MLTIDTSRTAKTCIIEGSGASAGPFVENKPGVTIYAIDGSLVKANLVRKLVVDAGEREIVAQTSDALTYIITASLEEGKTYQIEGFFLALSEL
ncbi:hypothetical protein N9195_00175 [bacterium]|nr:hypothetical protein [bacterium]